MALQWVKANRQATLIAGLLVLLLLVFLAAVLVRRRKNAEKAKRSGQTLAQPKHTPGLAMNSPAFSAPVNSSSSNMPSREVVHENTARPGASGLNRVDVPVVSANGARKTGTQENAEPARLATEQVFATNKVHSAVVAPNHAWVPPGPSSGSSADEDQEREVFEL